MKNFRKNVLRLALRNKASLIGASMIIALGILVFIGMCSSALCLDITKTDFFAGANLADIYVTATGIPDSQISAIKGIEGIRDVCGRTAVDVRINKKDQTLPVSLSLIGHDPDAMLDTFYIEGDAPKGDDIYLGKHMQKIYQYQIGDTIELVYNGKARRFTYRGTAQTPSLVEISNSASGYVDGSIYDMALISKESLAAFTGKGGSYTDLSISIENGYTFENLEQPLKDALAPYGLISIEKQARQESIDSIIGSVDTQLQVGYIFPVIFLAVAVFMLYVIIKKLVDRDRTLIGAMKAFGISDMEMVSAYLVQGAVLGFAGAVVGIILGYPLGNYMFNDILDYYNFPNKGFYIPMRLIIAAFVIALATGLIASFISVRSILKIVPSEAMKPPAPKSVKEIKVPDFIARQTGTLGKIAVRATTQNPMNGFLIVFAIAFSISMSSVTSNCENLMLQSVNNFYHSAIDYNATITMAEPSDPLAAKDAAMSIPYVTDAEAQDAYSVTLYNKGRTKNYNLISIHKDSRLYRIMDVERNTYPLDGGGMVISESTAKYLGLSPGDDIEFMISSLSPKRYRTFVSAVMKPNLGDVQYMSIEDLSGIMGIQPRASSVMIKADPAHMDDVSRYLQDGGKIVSVSFMEKDEQKLTDDLGATALAANVLGVFGMVAGILMVYNISMINFRERLGELGTMLILGRSEKDIGKMLFVEQMLYFVFGVALGLLLIPPMEKLVQLLVESDDLHLNMHTDISHILMILAACFVLVCVTNYRQYKAVSEIQLTDILKERC